MRAVFPRFAVACYQRITFGHKTCESLPRTRNRGSCTPASIMLSDFSLGRFGRFFRAFSSLPYTPIPPPKGGVGNHKIHRVQNHPKPPKPPDRGEGPPDCRPPPYPVPAFSHVLGYLTDVFRSDVICRQGTLRNRFCTSLRASFGKYMQSRRKIRGQADLACPQHPSQ